MIMKPFRAILILLNLLAFFLMITGFLLQCLFGFGGTMAGICLCALPIIFLIKGFYDPNHIFD